MSKENKRQINLGLIVGTFGFIAGIGLLFTASWLIGIFGSIASAGVVYKGYQVSKKLKN